jgi:hypothetical protein
LERTAGPLKWWEVALHWEQSWDLLWVAAKVLRSVPPWAPQAVPESKS